MPKKAKRGKIFVDGVDINVFNRQPDLEDAIWEAHKDFLTKEGKTKADIRQALKYNVMTIEQFGWLTGNTRNNINQKMRGFLTSDYKVHFPVQTCDPFRTDHLVFIYRNLKADKIIHEKCGYVKEAREQPAHLKQAQAISKSKRLDGKKPGSKIKDEHGFILEDPDIKSAWDYWVSERTAKGKKIKLNGTNRARFYRKWTKFLVEGSGCGGDHKKMIIVLERAAEGGWQGLHPWTSLSEDDKKAGGYQVKSKAGQGL